MTNDDKRAALKEAMDRLGLVRPEAEERLLALLRDQMDIHPRQISTNYRKEGEQLSKEEKKALGLRANAFLSRQAFADLTEEGLHDPLGAHETVLLRATFTLNRIGTLASLDSDQWKTLSAFKGQVKYDVLSMDCPSCSKLDGQIVAKEDAQVFPAEDCTCESANYTLRPHVDFLVGWNDEEDA